MAETIGIMLPDGLNEMVEGISEIPTLYLVAFSGVGGSTVLPDAQLVTLGTVSTGKIGMSGGFRTITIASGITVTAVRLCNTANALDKIYSEATGLTEFFENGGDLIIQIFTVEVTNNVA